MRHPVTAIATAAASGLIFGFGLAVFTRISGLPFLAALLPFMALVALIRRRLDLRSLTQLLEAALIVGVFVTPVLARNVVVYRSWSLTPQSGNHMANWIVPLVKEAMDGTPRETTNALTEARMRERYGLSSTILRQSDSHCVWHLTRTMTHTHNKVMMRIAFQSPKMATPRVFPLCRA